MKLAAALLLACAGAWAADDTAIGLRLGEPMAAQTVPPCPPGPRHQAPRVQCLAPLPAQADGRQFADVRWPPALPFDYTATVTAWRGVLAQISLEGDALQFDRAVAALVEKYGPPSRSDVLTVTSVAGAVVPARMLRWQLTAVRVTAIERASNVTEFAVIIEHAPTADAMREATETARAGKL